MVKVRKEMKILTKNRKGSLEIKNIVTEIENTFDGLISRVGTAEQRTFVRIYKKKPLKLNRKGNKD